MGCIRVEKMLDYIADPLNKGLNVSIHIYGASVKQWGLANFRGIGR